MKSVLADAAQRGALESFEVKSDHGYTELGEREQAEKLAKEWADWEAESVLEGCHLRILGFEAFVLRPNVRSADRAGLMPVRIKSLVEGMLCRQLAPGQIQMQEPAAAKGYATNTRLKQWGLWVKGSDHRRDAYRHLAHCLNGHIV